jgi:hypothetical protein
LPSVPKAGQIVKPVNFERKSDAEKHESFTYISNNKKSPLWKQRAL